MSTVTLARYNAHKRQTLDRLTQKYQLRARQVLKAQVESEVHRFHRELSSGKSSFQPSTSGLLDKLKRVFEAHQDDVVHVAVSDGIQEISPNNELGLWAEHPIGKPVELTLRSDLAKKRDEIVKGIKKKSEKKKKSKIEQFAEDLFGDYVRNIKDTFREVSSHWVNGVGTVDDVVSALKGTLQKTDNEALRVFRTETTNYFNETRHAYFSDNTAADYVELYAVTDGRISKICEDRHGFVIPMIKAALKKYMPAFHPNCRTIQRPLISTLSSHKSIIEKGLAMNESSFAPLPKGWA